MHQKGTSQSTPRQQELPNQRLVLKIAETKEELTESFRLLHDAYVANNFMLTHPSNLRVTRYHALPTTTILCAIYDGQVVGTISLIREGVYGFPMQNAFDLNEIRKKGGNIAEISSLAVHPKFRRAANLVVMPLMRFMYGYCINYFDTRHLIIAVNPSHIGFYESLFLFQRLKDQELTNYDFVNGAPAIGAFLDLKEAPLLMRKMYAAKVGRKQDLATYFLETDFLNTQWPKRRYYITNDPVMTPTLFHYFFNAEIEVFHQEPPIQVVLLHSIYNNVEYRDLLPPLQSGSGLRTRLHPRYTINCPATFAFKNGDEDKVLSMEMIGVSFSGFRVRVGQPIPMSICGKACIELGPGISASIVATSRSLVEIEGQLYARFRLDKADKAWALFLEYLVDIHNTKLS